jgi:hypothetical protein
MKATRKTAASVKSYHPLTQCLFDLEHFIYLFSHYDPEFWVDPYNHVGEIYGGEHGQGTEEGFALWILTRDFANLSEINDASDPRIPGTWVDLTPQQRTVSFLTWIKKERLQ